MRENNNILRSDIDPKIFSTVDAFFPYITSSPHHPRQHFRSARESHPAAPATSAKKRGEYENNLMFISFARVCNTACRYEKGSWSSCTNQNMTRVDTIKPNSDPSCEKTRRITKRCKPEANNKKATKGI